MLVTLRTRFRSMRSQFVYPTVRSAIAAPNRPVLPISAVRGKEAKRAGGRVGESGAESATFRVCEYSVQDEHVHLVVEASSKSALARGIRALSIRLAKRVNQLVFRCGRFIADRYHTLALKTPRAVRNALVYVLGNFRKHGHAAGSQVDPYSSGPYFRGFLEFAGVDVSVLVARFVPRALAPPEEAPVAPARTWLLAHGWLRHSRVSIRQRPKSSTRR